MRLYHFTAHHLANRIEKQGITKGAMPISLSPLKIKLGHIWLTTNGDFNNQPSLIGTGRLPYSRTETRFTVKIPENFERNLFRFIDHPELTPLFDVLTSKGDPSNWYVYKGVVHKPWIIARDEKERES